MIYDEARESRYKHIYHWAATQGKDFHTCYWVYNNEHGNAACVWCDKVFANENWNVVLVDLAQDHIHNGECKEFEHWAKLYDLYPPGYLPKKKGVAS